MDAPNDSSKAAAVSHEKIVDPLRSVTRNERRALLLVCLLLLTIVYGDLVPQKIDAFGVTLTEFNRRSLVIILAGVAVYYLFAFWLYAKADIAEWTDHFRQQVSNVEVNILNFRQLAVERNLSTKEPELSNFANELYAKPWNEAAVWYNRRMRFEYWFPINFAWITLVAALLRMFWSA